MVVICVIHTQENCCYYRSMNFAICDFSLTLVFGSHHSECRLLSLLWHFFSVLRENVVYIKLNWSSSKRNCLCACYKISFIKSKTRRLRGWKTWQCLFIYITRIRNVFSFTIKKVPISFVLSMNTLPMTIQYIHIPSQ